jgi:hypothetical protein
MAGRPELLTDELKEYIGRLLEDNPKLTARKVQGKVIEYLVSARILKAKSLELNWDDAKALLEADKSIPGTSVIGKYLTEKRKPKEPDPLSEPWSIGSCIKYEISADVIPLLVEYWQILSDESKPGGDISRRLTIRKARWMSRLYPVLEKTLKLQFPDQRNKWLGYLSRIADEYSYREQAAFEQKRDYPSTRLLDTLIFYRDNLELTIDEALLLAGAVEMTSDEFNNFMTLKRGSRKSSAKEGE